MEMSEESDIQKVMGFSGFGGRKCCMKGYGSLHFDVSQSVAR